MRLIGCCTGCLRPFSGRLQWSARACCNVCSCWCLNTYTSVRHCYSFHARMFVGVCLVAVQFGFLQLLQTQTWVKCTSLDSLRCVVYSGIKFEAIWAASKEIEQDKLWKDWSELVSPPTMVGTTLLGRPKLSLMSISTVPKDAHYLIHLHLYPLPYNHLPPPHQWLI